MKTKSVCSILQCISTQHCKGYCKKHYERFRIHGNPYTHHSTGPKHKNIVGQKINMWTIIGDLNEQGKDNEYFVRARCDCGKEKKVNQSHILNNTSKSCGCSGRRTGIESGKFQLLRRYKKSAKRRNIDFKLEESDFFNLVFKECHYCGIGPNKNSYHIYPHSREHFLYNGIDRKENEIGYTKENSVTCCYQCNVAKGKQSYKEFISYLDRIATKRKQNKPIVVNV